MENVRNLTAEEVANHTSKDDLWLTIHGKVYNVTSYVRDHPGGSDVLFEIAGSDATQEYDDAGHSEDATEILGTFLIGQIEGHKEVQRKKKTGRVIQEAVQPHELSVRSTSYSLPVIAVASIPLSVVAIYALGGSMLDFSGGLIRISRALGRWQMAQSFFATTPSQAKPLGATFTGGFSVASMLWMALGGYLGRAMSTRLLHVDTGFTKYPLHTKPANRVVQASPHLKKGILEPQAYKELPLVEMVELAPNIFRFVFSLPKATDIIGLPIGQHVAIKAIVDGKPVSRSYTPTSNNLDRGYLELVIKCYPDGLLTGHYLSKLKIGDMVSFRGPKGAMKYYNGLCKKIGMVAGGTGITPMYQLIRAICENDTDATEVSLVYANRTEGDILLRHELETFARNYPQNLKIWYMLDEPPASWKFGKGYVTTDVLHSRLPAAAPDTKIMLCGPPGMINGSKKALQSLGFAAPGSVSRMTDQIFCF